MGANVIVISVDGNKYKVEKNGISDFALIGVLECVLADMKAARRQQEGQSAPKALSAPPADSPVNDPPVNLAAEPSAPESGEFSARPSNAVEEGIAVQSETSAATPDIRARILKAREAIRELKGEVDNSDLSKMSAEELQAEFDELSAQYRRLKNSKSAKKK